MTTSRERMQLETEGASERIALGDARYPENLREITTPPERLYVRGRFTEEDALAVAIVGSRARSPRMVPSSRSSSRARVRSPDIFPRATA